MDSALRGGGAGARVESRNLRPSIFLEWGGMIIWGFAAPPFPRAGELPHSTLVLDSVRRCITTNLGPGLFQGIWRPPRMKISLYLYSLPEGAGSDLAASEIIDSRGARYVRRPLWAFVAVYDAWAPGGGHF